MVEQVFKSFLLLEEKKEFWRAAIFNIATTIFLWQLKLKDRHVGSTSHHLCHHIPNSVYDSSEFVLIRAKC